MDDTQIHNRITALIEAEHELRAKVASGDISSVQERAELKATEEALDQCWDLLRQRQARRQYGQNPDDAAVRPASEVEGYQQ
jgi:Protein of unknown function (DUF2630)